MATGDTRSHGDNTRTREGSERRSEPGVREVERVAGTNPGSGTGSDHEAIEPANIERPERRSKPLTRAQRTKLAKAKRDAKRDAKASGADRGEAKPERTRKSASEATSDLAGLLYSLHFMGAAFLKIPDMALTEDESRNLATAVVRVTELYDLPLMSEEARAWINLTMVAGNVYGTRIASHAIEAKRARTAAREATQQPGSPTPINTYQEGGRVQ